MRKLIAFAVCVAVCFVPSSFGSILAIWNFGDSASVYTQNPAYHNTVTSPTLTLAGVVDPDGKNGVAYTDAGGVDHIPGQAAAWDDVKKSGNHAALFITLDTTGFTDLAIRWDYKSELAVSFDLAYRTSAGGSWTHVVNNYPITPGWDTGTWYAVALDLPAVLDNQPYVELRLDDLDRDTGNDKFAIDNIEITGVPEPATLLLVGAGGLILRWRKKG